MIQFFEGQAFIDKRESHHSVRCQPRDIELVGQPEDKRLIERIVMDIRIGQGENQIGAGRNMFWS